MNKPTGSFPVSLADKYDKKKGRVLITGTQALVRILLIQKELDEKAGLNTRGYVSGYRGSPMGTLDSMLWREKKRVAEAGVVFTPGVNEDLAATAVWGTQQLAFFPEPKVEGVYAMWYGKAPGVDRSTDVFRHGNMAGSSPKGGVLLAVGDDHPGKSSTVVNQSEPILAALGIPVLYPSNVQEIIEFGLMGWAMSRYTGLWVGLKSINETVEQTQSVDIDLDSFEPVLPDRGPNDATVNLIAPAFAPQAMETHLLNVRIPLVGQFVRANKLDKEFIGGKGGLGIVTSGKGYNDVMQALALLGIDEDQAKNMGISIYKVGCIWPLEETGITEFANGRDELLFVEEKQEMLEGQTAKIMVNVKNRPMMFGKTDENNQPLLPSDIQLQPAMIARVVIDRLQKLGTIDKAQAADLIDPVTALTPNTPPPPQYGGGMRMPHFCSGCPHNTSTKLPDGSLAMAGIGCHALAILTRKDTLPPTQMGGEGMNWAGAACFSGTKHMFQNLGDGTYYHSGLLAIRGAVASGVNITYKILYNDAVAMTGGQPIDGPISVSEMIRQVQSEGISKVVLVTDSPDAYRGKSDFKGLEIHHRDDLIAVQEQMREIEGTSILIYEQTCAAEKRRRRKRGNFPNPAKRMFINQAVCEGCGDCSEQSTCVSIQPVETEFGTKRRIDQSSCNKDFSCKKGFCPSFVTVLDAEPKKPKGKSLNADLFSGLPTPVTVNTGNSTTSIMIAGIGGTGVITVGAVLGMAAHIEGKATSIYDMTGVAQKNGAVYSHLKIANNPEDIATQRIGAGQADLVLGFDLIAALGGDANAVYHPENTKVIGNDEVVPTSAFQYNRNLSTGAAAYLSDITGRVCMNNAHFVDASRLALTLLGDTIGANMFVVGYALQSGFLPLNLASIREAIKLNGVALDFNLRAFDLGRLYAHNPAAVDALDNKPVAKSADTLDDIIAAQSTHLTGYQDAAYAKVYIDFVSFVRKVESKCRPGSDVISKSVARNLAKVMSYKDEYEVACLYADPAFLERLDNEFESGYKLKFNLAPPLLSTRDKRTGHLKKREFGAYMLPAFKVLAKLKGLRGGKLDVFGYSAERRAERALIETYRDAVTGALNKLTPATIDTVVEIANIPDQIRGYGHVKEAAMQQAAENFQTLDRKLATKA